MQRIYLFLIYKYQHFRRFIISATGVTTFDWTQKDISISPTLEYEKMKELVEA